MFEFKVKIQDRKNISENSYQGIPIFVFILHSQVTTLKECKLVNFDVPLFLRGFNIFLETIYVDMYVHILPVLLYFLRSCNARVFVFLIICLYPLDIPHQIQDFCSQAELLINRSVV